MESGIGQLRAMVTRRPACDEAECFAQPLHRLPDILIDELGDTELGGIERFDSTTRNLRPQLHRPPSRKGAERD
jgi:hypothetical protein